MSHQVQAGQVEQCYNDGRSRNDAGDSGRSVFGFDEVG